MSNENYNNSFYPEDAQTRKILSAIQKTDGLVKIEEKANNLKTKNGSGGRWWDYANTSMISQLMDQPDCMVQINRKGIWKFVFVVDFKNQVLYTLMNENRFAYLQKKASNGHYVKQLAGALNRSCENQIFMDGLEDQQFPKAQEILNDLNLSMSYIKAYNLLLFKLEYGMLKSARYVLVDSNLDIIDEMNLNALISAGDSVHIDFDSDTDAKKQNAVSLLQLTDKARKRLAQDDLVVIKENNDMRETGGN